MKLLIEVEGSYLYVMFLNNKDKPKRFWEFNNSWGWFTISFNLKGGSAVEMFKIYRKEREWTANIPTFIEMTPYKEYKMKINFLDGWWDLNNEISRLEDKNIFIMAVLEIHSTPEAIEHEIFTGKIETDWMESLPPHKWLFPGPKNEK